MFGFGWGSVWLEAAGDEQSQRRHGQRGEHEGRRHGRRGGLRLQRTPVS